MIIDHYQRNVFSLSSHSLLYVHMFALPSFLCSASVVHVSCYSGVQSLLPLFLCVKVYVADKGVRVRGAKYTNVLLPHCQQFWVIIDTKIFRGFSDRRMR